MRSRSLACPLGASILSTLTFFFLSLVLTGGTADAQYFGRNKVQYKDFDFKVLHTDHFDIYYYRNEEEAARIAARMAERWYARLSRLFGDTLRGKQPLILYASHPEFQQTNAIQGELSEGVGGVTESAKRRIVLPMAGPLRETDHVIGHELVHAFQYDMTGQGRGGFSAAPAAERLPLWFIEGMAEYFSLGPVDPNTAMWMREAAQKELPTISQLNDPEFFPYRYGQALLSYIGGKWGDKRLIDLLRTAGRSGDINRALDSLLVLKPDSLSKEWHAAVHAAYDSLIKATSKPSEYGSEIISKNSGGGNLNVSPVISPDGKRIVFFSERDQFSVDLFLADAATGKIIRNLYRTETDPHIQILGFINSAGAWDPSGERFVLPIVREGKSTLRILNVEKNETEREIPFPELGEILSPAWSPDGKFIAFSALVGGLSDLYLYELATGAVRRLTDDPYADLQPSWSPDGSTLVFVTDRFTTDLKDLKIGNYGLATLNVQSGRIAKLPTFDHAKNINPQWSQDGRSLYFLSDRTGITNIYRLDVESGSVSQVTNLYGGVSGITGTSPALSLASKSNRMVYSVFENGKYNIYLADSANVLAGTSLTPSPSGDPAILPPAHRRSETLVALLKDPHVGLPPDTSFQTSDYRARLSLDAVGQPSIAAGVDRFGTYVGGGVSLFWSDMLGNHNLATALQISSGGGSTDIAALAAYFNTTHRWNWGVAAQQIPYITSSYASGYGFANNVPAYIEQQIIYRQINREISGILSYPFSPALRTEFYGGYRNISFKIQQLTTAVDLRSGGLIVDTDEELPAPSALNMGFASAALVYDNSVFGATGPILGSRYRLEFSPTVGSLNWYDVLADYRQYVMPFRPITLAGRVLHYGRYGKDSEDGRLTPLFLGYPGLVRGYESGSFTIEDCRDSSCSNLNELQGSRLLVGNFELRFPLFGILGIGRGYYGAFPLELGGFFDAGTAWTSGGKSSFLGIDRKWVRSAGIVLRVNLFGFAIGEVDYVRPLDRVSKEWRWQFNLTQGF